MFWEKWTGKAIRNQQEEEIACSVKKQGWDGREERGAGDHVAETICTAQRSSAALGSIPFNGLSLVLGGKAERHQVWREEYQDCF